MNQKPDFDEEKLTLVLDIKNGLFDLRRFEKLAKEKKLSEKEELHITIIGRETGEAIKNKFENTQEYEVLRGKIKKLIEEESWDFSISKTAYLLTKIYEDGEKRSSIIQMIELPGLKDFYRKLKRFLDLGITLPHVTLFTASSKKENMLRGIGIYSEKQFKGLNPELIK